MAVFSCNVQKTNIPDAEYGIQRENGFDETLKGKWVLEYITPINGKKINELYKIQRPYLTFIDVQKVAGNNGCNNIAGEYKAEPNKIQFFTDKFIATKMFCEGVNEAVFTNELKKINGYSIINEENKLVLMAGDIVIMEFKRSKG